MTDDHPTDDQRALHGAGAKYVAALVALLLLTAVSYAVSRASLGTAGAAIALSIAGVKVTIVGLVFMELLASVAVTRLVAVVAVLFVVLLCLGIAGDVAFR